MENFSLLNDCRTYNVNINNNNVGIEDHRNKSYMGDSSSITCTTPFVYDPTVPISKGEMSTAKNNYSTYTACAQQLNHLDHRSVIDANMDASVSLGALCDLKFPPENSTILIDSNANFKGLPPLLNNLETNQIMSGLQKINTTMDLNETSFSNLLFATDATNNNNNLSPHTIGFLPAPVNLVQTTAESSQHHYLPNTSIAGAAGTCKPIITSNANLMDYVLDSTTLTNRNNDHFITTPATTTASNNTANMNADTSIANIILQPPSTRSIVHSIGELAATSNTITSSTITSLNTPINGGHIIAATSLCSAASTVPSLIKNNNKRRKTHQQQQQLPTPAQIKINSCSRQHRQPKVLKRSQERPREQHLNTDNSNSSNDNVLELIQGGAGYQDNTSSHSQQSANGGGSGGNNGNGPQNPSAGVSLINGIVTLNSGQNPALTGGGNNGGSPASSASGTYMPLLPPNVGATSSSAAHMGGVSALGVGTSASASASGAEHMDFKHLFEELCPVCGDKVSGYHYGLLTCESCKGFFKRTVQNKKVYTCVAERSCHIDKTQRKRCPFCRFQKCLDVGMKLEAVRADRMRGGRNKFGPMYKRDRARKLQVMRQRQIALQALRSINTTEIKSTPLSPGYQQAYSNLNIKQEIQIPQVSSLTQSPDSSPSPIAIALGQVNPSSGVIATPMNGNSGVCGGGGGGGTSGNGNSINLNTNNTSDGINRVGSGSGGSSGSSHETGAASLQNASDLKLCFNAGSHPSSTADSIIEPLKVSPMIREFVQSVDDSDWQRQLSSLLQKQTYNQVEVDLFELMCKVLDQNLFSQVDWARNTVFFKELKVDDQMKLLQHSWSDMLVLDHLHQRIHNGLPDETQLNNGQTFSLLNLGLLGVVEVTDYFNELQNKLRDLRFDMGDYVCMKFLILLNPKVNGIVNKKSVLQGYENVQAALLDYTLTSYPSVTEKYSRLLSILPDIHAMASRGEDFLYIRHCEGGAPTQTLLMEMLSAKRKA